MATIGSGRTEFVYLWSYFDKQKVNLTNSGIRISFLTFILTLPYYWAWIQDGGRKQRNSKKI